MSTCAEGRWGISATFHVFSLLEDPIFVCDQHETVLFWNRAAETAYGWSTADAIGQSTTLLFGSDDAARAVDAVSAVRQAHHWRGEISRLQKNGRSILVDCQRGALAFDAGIPTHVVDFSRDKSNFQRQETQLKDTARILQAVMDNTSSYIHVRDYDGRFLYVNEEYERVFRVGGKAVVGKLIEEVFPTPISIARRAMHETVLRNPVDSHAEVSEVVNCKLRTFMDVKSPLFDESGQVVAVYCIGTDITERKALESRTLHLAHYDNVTGLPNRTLFHERLKNALVVPKANGDGLALMFLDLDGFKDINDTLGHEIGDRLLAAVGKRLQANVRHYDTVARVGGDEFTVILENIQVPNAVESIAQKLLTSLQLPFPLDGKEIYVTGSIGITVFPEDAYDSSTLIRNADNAMYASKRAGPGGYRFYTEKMNAATSARLQITTDLKRALRDGQFQLEYQPIISFSDGTIRKAEALIRWHHPKKGLISPSEFIPIAENTGDIIAIGEWVFQEAVKQCAYWRQHWHPDFQISINTSPIQYRNAGIDLNHWLILLADQNVPAHAIVLEITEGLLMDATVNVQKQLQACSDAGMEIALDDFGTGYSSLSYLKKFEVDYLKIDRSFVTNLSKDSDDHVVCEAIIAMAHKLGLRVIAEGIETVTQFELLTAAGCDFAQGYLFSKPMDALLIDMTSKQYPHASRNNVN